jgi:hypothetical protein
MDTLEEKISSLESEIEGYKSELKDPAATKEEKCQLRGLIVSARETLNRRLDEKKEMALQFAGELICCSSLPLNFISITSMLLIYLSSFDYFLMFSKLHCIYLQFLENDCVVLNSILFLFPAIFSSAIILR